MADSISSAFACPAPDDTLYWWHSACGQDRDCVPDSRQNTFPVGWCGALWWVAKGQGRYVDLFEPHNARRMWRINAKAATPGRLGKCGDEARYGASGTRGSQSDGDRFSISIPGISDILRVPGLDSPALRRDRVRRFMSSRSALPSALQPLVKILNKLDDAQDLLFTGLALAWPLLKLVGARIVPGLGWLLLANDILNAMT